MQSATGEQEAAPSVYRRRLSGWGRYPFVDCDISEPRDERGFMRCVTSGRTLIGRGNGRAYGDAAVHSDLTVATRHHNRILAFDPETGRMECESGVLLADIVENFAPRGWFPPVTPGTKYVSIGGMIAADVHGKNHHRDGSFCRYVESMRLLTADGDVAVCSRGESERLFRATCGGMGLTGVILSAVWRLRKIGSVWIRQETLRCRNLEEAMQALESSGSWSYTVAWIDTLARGDSIGRAVVYRGEHAEREEVEARTPPLELPKHRRLGVPICPPVSVLNRASVAAFNEGYFRRNRPGSRLIDLDQFFYPLDGVAGWNKLYGRSGFTQFQCVLPPHSSRAGTETLLQACAASGSASFLAVLKLLGAQDTGLISFPMPGYTLALDLPLHRGTRQLLERLHAIVLEHHGRIYLAKDALADPSVVHGGYPNLTEFREIRKRTGADRRFVSHMSQRLSL